MAERRTSAGSRPTTSSQMRLKLAYRSRRSRPRAPLNSSAYLRRQGGGALGAGPADDDLGALDRPGDGGAVGELVVLAVEAEPLARLGVPEAGEDRQLLFQTVEPLAEAGERDAEVLVLALVPGGADAELGPASAHLGDGRDLDRELAGKPEGGGVDERAEPDPLGLDGEAGQRGPGVGRLVGGVVGVDAEVVVGAEERVEPARLRRLREGQDLGVGGPVVRFEEDPEAHEGGPFSRRTGRSRGWGWVSPARWRWSASGRRPWPARPPRSAGSGRPRGGRGTARAALAPRPRSGRPRAGSGCGTGSRTGG